MKKIIIFICVNFLIFSAAFAKTVVTKPSQVSNNLFGNAVITAPYIGRDNYFDGLELIINSPSINEDVSLLKRRNEELTYLKQQGITPPFQPRLVLSGKVEVEASSSTNYSKVDKSDMNLDAVELDSLAEITPMVNGFFSIKYDKYAAGASQRRIDNSNILLDKAFITIGDFSRSPLYFSGGQLYVPFGKYSSSTISGTLTHMGKTKARAFVFGYASQTKNSLAPFASVFVFKGDTTYDKQYGGNIGFNFKQNKIHGSMGASYLANIADSADMQNTFAASTSFQGFSLNETLAHAVPAADFYGNIGYGAFGILGEYITTLKSFAPTNLSFNGHGAAPKAYHVEGSYGFHVSQLPASFALSFSRSIQALALNIPAYRYAAHFEITPLKDTSLEFELSRNEDYKTSDSASGQGTATPNGTGQSSYGAEVSFSVFF